MTSSWTNQHNKEDQEGEKEIVCEFCFPRRMYEEIWNSMFYWYDIGRAISDKCIRFVCCQSSKFYTDIIFISITQIIMITIFSPNGLLPDGTKPLHEQVSIYNQ